MAFPPTDRFNIADYFLEDRIGEGRGDRVALRTAAEHLTYAQVSRLSNRFASLVEGMGCVPGDRIMIALPDTPFFPGALFGILKAGCQVVMVNPHLGSEQVDRFYQYVEPALVLTTSGPADVFGPPPGGQVLVLDGEHRGALEAASEDFETVATRPEDPAIWLFSGGTTGQPKGVVQSHRSFANTTERYGKG
ncbi:MAG: acyl-CoA synthetase, partial [Gemmatimonadetes bacterium]|nr:acyl-CoA synthetase [Gemmatimonadota bacterium]